MYESRRKRAAYGENGPVIRRIGSMVNRARFPRYREKPGWSPGSVSGRMRGISARLRGGVRNACKSEKTRRNWGANGPGIMRIGSSANRIWGFVKSQEIPTPDGIGFRTHNRDAVLYKARQGATMAPESGGSDQRSCARMPAISGYGPMSHSRQRAGDRLGYRKFGHNMAHLVRIPQE